MGLSDPKKMLGKQGSLLEWRWRPFTNNPFLPLVCTCIGWMGAIPSHPHLPTHNHLVMSEGSLLSTPWKWCVSSHASAPAPVTAAILLSSPTLISKTTPSASTTSTKSWGAAPHTIVTSLSCNVREEVYTRNGHSLNRCCPESVAESCSCMCMCVHLVMTISTSIPLAGAIVKGDTSFALATVYGHLHCRCHQQKQPHDAIQK